MNFHIDFQSTVLCHYGVDFSYDSPSIITSSYSCHYGVCHYRVCSYERGAPLFYPLTSIAFQLAGAVKNSIKRNSKKFLKFEPTPYKTHLDEGTTTYQMCDFCSRTLTNWYTIRFLRCLSPLFFYCITLQN